MRSPTSATKSPMHATKGGSVTPQEVSDFETTLRERREDLTLYKAPILTLSLFCAELYYLGTKGVRAAGKHWAFRFMVVPLLTIWALQRWVVYEHPFRTQVDSLQFAVEYVVWWVGLGILSSVGLGSGLQSGVLFLYPHVISTVLAAQNCGTTAFESETQIWFRSSATLFFCSANTNGGDEVGYWDIWFKIFPACFLQAAGTAIGEIPPYWMTRAARLAAIEAGTSSPNDIPEELDTEDGDKEQGKVGNAIGMSLAVLVLRGKLWMMRLLKEHGFLGVLLMASFPNLAFDLCGICCGHFLMPFWVFFGATFLGKAVIRNGYQSLVYVAICNERYLEALIGVLQRVTPSSLEFDARIRSALEGVRTSFQQVGTSADSESVAADGTGAIDLKLAWQAVTGTMLCLFFVSFVAAVAQFHQLRSDQEAGKSLRARLPATVRQGITSPKSGRLMLPPPTPKAARRPVDTMTADSSVTVGESIVSSGGASSTPASAVAASRHGGRSRSHVRREHLEDNLARSPAATPERVLPPRSCKK